MSYTSVSNWSPSQVQTNRRIAAGSILPFLYRNRNHIARGVRSAWSSPYNPRNLLRQLQTAGGRQINLRQGTGVSHYRPRDEEQVETRNVRRRTEE